MHKLTSSPKIQLVLLFQLLIIHFRLASCNKTAHVLPHIVLMQHYLLYSAFACRGMLSYHTMTSDPQKQKCNKVINMLTWLHNNSCTETSSVQYMHDLTNKPAEFEQTLNNLIINFNPCSLHVTAALPVCNRAISPFSPYLIVSQLPPIQELWNLIKGCRLVLSRAWRLFSVLEGLNMTLQANH